MSKPRTYKLMACPKCGADSLVVNAEGTPRGILRRRKCSKCNRGFASMETVLGQDRSIPDGTLVKALAQAGLAVVWADAPGNTDP